MRRVTKRSGALLIAAIVASVLAGSVVAAQFGGDTDLEALSSATRGEPLTQVADIPEGNGKAARGVFAQLTSTGHFCLWDAPSANSLQRQGGCDPIDDPLGGHRLSASLAYDGGPGIESVTDARLIGLVTPEVAGIAVLMSDGSRRSVHLKQAHVGGESYQAFGVRLKRADLRRGVGPTAVVAFDSAGHEIDRQTTGF